MQVDNLVGHPGRLQCLLIGSGAGGGKIEHAYDGGSERAAIRRRPTGDIVGDDSAHPVGRASERDERPVAGDPIADFDSIADSIDRRVVGPQMLIHANAAAFADRQPCLAGELDLRPHAEPEHDHVGWQSLAILQDNDGGGRFLAILRRFEADDLLAKFERDPLLTQFGMNVGGHFRIKRGQDLSKQLGHGDAKTATMELLRHFQADIAAADDHRSFRIVLGNPFINARQVGDIAERECASAIDSRNRWNKRGGARREDQLVIALAVFAVSRQIAYRDLFCPPIDGNDLAADTNIQVEDRPQALGSLDEQFPFVGDFAAQVIWQATVGERHMGAALEDDDVGRFVEPPQPGSGTRPAGDAADNQHAPGHNCELPFPFRASGSTLWTRIWNVNIIILLYSNMKAAMKTTLSPDQLEAVSRLFAALAEPTRLALLQALRKGSRPVGDLVDELDAKQANISKQLGMLYAAGLVSRERHGNEVHYSIRDPVVFDLCQLVCGKLRRDAERQADAFHPHVSRAKTRGR